MIKVHHIDCASMCPIGSRVFPSVFPPRICCHCLLVETDDSLVLVDTGLGTADFETPGKRLGPARHLLAVEDRPEMPAIRQLPALGFTPDQVRHIVVTHLDLDHAGGISDFPHAEVHVTAAELKEARNPTLLNRTRYRPMQFAEHQNWREHDGVSGENWFGFEAVRDIPGLPPEVLLIPLAGHSAGHMGIAVQSGDTWRFHVGDAFYHPGQLEGEGPSGLRLFSKLVDHDLPAADHNRARLLHLMKSEPTVEVFCAHDPAPLERLAGRPT